MPQIFKIGSYVIYFWANEGRPIEPIHIHIAKSVPAENATKIWITKAGKCLLCNNNSKIPAKTLKNIMEIIEARNSDVVNKWLGFFGEVYYYC
ncbi:MAG: DUF4160 domain-containing protein [Oscillospiraceae bacterium]|nr:DUF4160 domain-containing protein [Oscillospiraceae bacterium]